MGAFNNLQQQGMLGQSVTNSVTSAQPKLGNPSQTAQGAASQTVANYQNTVGQANPAQTQASQNMPLGQAAGKGGSVVASDQNTAQVLPSQSVQSTNSQATQTNPNIFVPPNQQNQNLGMFGFRSRMQSAYPNTINKWDNSQQSPMGTGGKGSTTASSQLPSPLTKNSPMGGSGKGV